MWAPTSRCRQWAAEPRKCSPPGSNPSEQTAFVLVRALVKCLSPWDHAWASSRGLCTPRGAGGEGSCSTARSGVHRLRVAPPCQLLNRDNPSSTQIQEWGRARSVHGTLTRASRQSLTVYKCFQPKAGGEMMVAIPSFLPAEAMLAAERGQEEALGSLFSFGGGERPGG